MKIEFTIKQKLISLIASLLILLIIVSSVAIIKLQISSQQFEVVEKEDLPSITYSVSLNSIILEQEKLIYQFFFSDNISERDLAKKNFHQKEREFRHTLKEFMAQPLTSEEKQHLKEVNNQYDTFIFAAVNLFEDNRNHSSQVRNSIFNNFSAIAKDMSKTCSEFYLEEQRKVKETATASRVNASQTVKTTSLLGLFAVIIGVIMGAAISRSINQPIKNLILVSNNIAKGDLTQFADDQRRDELGILAGSFNQMIQGLNDLLKEIASQAEIQIQMAQDYSMKQMTQIKEVQDRLMQITGGIEETTSNIEIITYTTQTSSDSARERGEEAKQSTESIGNLTKDIKIIMDLTNYLLNQLAEIKSIAEIIGEFAEDTNLLALNASIEAARAGEFGRAFAVVAQEVRKLAEGSATSTKEIKDKLLDIQLSSDRLKDALQSGRDILPEAQKHVLQISAYLFGLISSLDKVSSEVINISAAMQEISASVQGINKDIDYINHLNEATTADLTEQAKSLRGVLEKFKVKD